MRSGTFKNKVANKLFFTNHICKQDLIPASTRRGIQLIVDSVKPGLPNHNSELNSAV